MSDVDNAPASPRRQRLIIFFVVSAVFFSAVVILLAMRDEPRPQYRLGATTMVPVALSVRQSDVECPVAPVAASPIEFSDVSATSTELPLYDGDLVVTRFDVFAQTVPPDGQIRFTATWPTAVVGLGSPHCVFIVGNPDDVDGVNWRSNGDGTTDFVILDPLPLRTIRIEVWLVADDPESGDTFMTDVTTDAMSDSTLVDPVGGRATVRKRLGAPADVAIDVVSAGDGATFDVVARVANNQPTTRALSVSLELTSTALGVWTLGELSASGCQGGESVNCVLDGLGAGEFVEINATLRQADGWVATPVTCDGPNGGSGFGLCVEATSSAASGPTTVERVAAALVELPLPQNEEIAIRTDPERVVARAGEVAEFAFMVIATGPGDLGSVGVTGSDCVELERVPQAFDDLDAFLESGEAWRFVCSLDVSESAVFRFDTVATTASGEILTASYEGVVDVIVPSLSVESSEVFDEPTVIVTNSGDSTVFDVAVILPGCVSNSVVEGVPTQLRAGEFAAFGCEDGSLDPAGVVAYAVDELGNAVVARATDDGRIRDDGEETE